MQNDNIKLHKSVQNVNLRRKKITENNRVFCFHSKKIHPRTE